MPFDAGAIASTMSLDTSGFAQGMLQAQGLAELFPSVVTNFIANPLLGIVSAAEQMASAVKNAFTSLASDARAVGNAAQQAGVSVGFLSTVGKASEVGVNGLADSFKFLNRNLAETQEKTPAGEQLAATFAKAGISAADLKAAISGGTAGLENLFLRIGDGVSHLGSNAEKTRLTMELFGRAGADLIPTFDKGSQAILAQAQKIAQLGGETTAAEVATGRSVHQVGELFDAAFEGIKKAVTQPLFDAFGANLDSIIASIGDFASGIKSGVATAIEIAKPLVLGLLDAFKGLGSFVGAELGPVFTLLVPVLRTVAQVLGEIFSIIGKVLGSIGSAISSVSEFFGLSSPSPAAGASPESSAAGGGGSGNVNVGAVNVNGVDVATASSVLAAKIQPQIAAAQSEQKNALAAAASGSKVNRAVRGK